MQDLESGGYILVDDNQQIAVTPKGELVLSVYKFALKVLRFSPEEFVTDPELASELY